MLTDHVSRRTTVISIVCSLSECNLNIFIQPDNDFSDNVKCEHF